MSYRESIDTYIYKTFDLLRFPLAILVVFLHIAPVITPYYDLSCTDWTPAAYVYLNMTICKIATCAVPCFFFISGYLFFYKITVFSFSQYISKLRNRFKTLVIPYVIWNILAVIYLKATSQLPGTPTLGFIFLSPANFPLWFLRNLIVLVILTPIFYLICRYIKWIGFGIISILFIVSYSYEFGSKFIFISFYFFYSGCLLGYKKIKLWDLPKIYKSLSLIVFIATLILEITVGGKFAWSIDNIFLISGVFTLLNIADFVIRRYNVTIPAILVSSPFFIYAAHKLGPTFISKQVIEFLPITSTFIDAVVFIICPFLAALICVGLYAILKRFVPKLLYLLTGR